MPAKVEFRLGSIFDEPCDLLVIPSSAGGIVTPGMQQELRKAGIPFPGAMPWGSVKLAEFTGSRFKRVAYAATVGGQGPTPEIVRKIGEQLGTLAHTLKDGRLHEFMVTYDDGLFDARFRKPRIRPFGWTISAPLLGAGSGDLEPAVAATALQAGFVSTAPAGGRLVINVRDNDDYQNVAAALRNPSRAPEAAAPAAPRVRTAVAKHGIANKNGPTLPFHLQSALKLLSVKPRTARPATIKEPAAKAPAPLPAAKQPSSKPVSAEQPTSDPPAAIQAPEKQRTKDAPASAASAATPSDRKGVFISYSHADAEWLERLQKHLKPLQREGIDVWDDTRLKAGEQWREEIRQALAQTKVAILLISADFLASDFIATDELPPLLKAAEEDGATILPVIVSPCRFTRMESLSRFQAVNDPAKPLVQMRRGNREKVLDQVARAVEDALNR